MFVIDLSGDSPALELPKGSLTWELIEKAIRQLDAKSSTEVSIAGPGEAHMSISGGDNQYLICATFDNDDFYSPMTPQASKTETVRFVAGGQMISCTKDEIVELKTALKVAKAFAERGELDQTVRWDNDLPETRGRA